MTEKDILTPNLNMKTHIGSLNLKPKLSYATV